MTNKQLSPPLVACLAADFLLPGATLYLRRVCAEWWDVVPPTPEAWNRRRRKVEALNAGWDVPINQYTHRYLTPEAYDRIGGMSSVCFALDAGNLALADHLHARCTREDPDNPIFNVCVYHARSVEWQFATYGPEATGYLDVSALLPKGDQAAVERALELGARVRDTTTTWACQPLPLWPPDYRPSNAFIAIVTALINPYCDVAMVDAAGIYTDDLLLVHNGSDVNTAIHHSWLETWHTNRAAVLQSLSLDSFSFRDGRGFLRPWDDDQLRRVGWEAYFRPSRTDSQPYPPLSQ